MKNYNRNIRHNVLDVVAKRLLPKNQFLQFQRTQCQVCIKEERPSACEGQKSQIVNKDRMESKCKGRLALWSNLYEVKVERSEGGEVSSPRRLLKVISSKSQTKTSQTEIRNQSQEKERIKKAIREWVTYALDSFHRHSSPVSQIEIVLPLETDEEMSKLKSKIKELGQAQASSDMKVFHSRDSMMSQSQTLNSSLFKKSIKVPEIELDPVFPQDRSQSTQKERSFKLLNSASTIGSQRNIIKMNERSYDELIRLLFVQATTIQSFL